jgi:hypothetical protein
VYPKFSNMMLLGAQVCEVLPLLEWRAPIVAGWRSCCFGEDTCTISDNSCGRRSSCIACRFNSICYCNRPRMSNSRCRNMLGNGQEFQCNLLSPKLADLTKSGMMDGHSVLENDIGTSKNEVFVCIIRLVHVHF